MDVPNQQYAMQGQILDTIHEETESSTTHSKVNDTIQNPPSLFDDSVTPAFLFQTPLCIMTNQV